MPGVLFPHLGFATAEGTILQWMHGVDEDVRAGAPLLEIASEKAVHVVVHELFISRRKQELERIYFVL